VTANDKEIIVKSVEHPDKRIVLKPNEPIFLRSSDVFTAEGLSVLDDLTQLTHLHEPAVLSSLQNRFDIDKIYTFTGPILIALNPFKRIHNLYDGPILKSFITNQTSGGKPHVFNTSNCAYRGICDRQKCQTVLISGESGAGKTETTKHVMKFLAEAGAGDEGKTDVEKQVLESNPLLEAFGNARTLRNDNSSRFGKFIELQFQTKDGEKIQAGVAGSRSRLCGARIQTYLLERVRVADQQEGERNYHIFYEACAAAATLPAGSTEYAFPTLLAKDRVKTERTINLEGFSELSDFAYLTRSTCRTLKDTNDVEMFERRISAMQTVGVKPEDTDSILQVMAAVLHLGNIKFDAPANNSEGSMVMQECDTNFTLACKLLSVNRQDLESALCNSTRATRTEKIKSPVNVRVASDNRDALAKALYGMIFNFIVRCTNSSIGYRDDVTLFAGVLDIFGFECFKQNSFEQLCINFTNERLQQFFNQFVFKIEEQLYEREGIPWDPLDLPDNQDAVDLLQAKPSGIFSMLDEECMVPNGSDQGFCNKLMKQHKGHRRFDEIKTKPLWFTIKHFAGPVAYSSESFLDKNRDQMNNDIIECMGSSANQFVTNLFRCDVKYAELFNKEEAGQDTKKKKKITVSSEFKEQLSHLMDIVDTTEPHFIRCIKPNPENEPDRYNRKSVTEQLRYGGVLQVVQVSRAGYPVRINHQECWDDYKVIGSVSVVSGLKHLDDFKMRAQKLLEHLSTELNIAKPSNTSTSWAVGKSLVFFKQDAYDRLKFARLDLLIRNTTIIQAHWRRKNLRDKYKAIRIFTKHLQALLRGKQSRLDLMKRRREGAATKMQAFGRKIAVRRAYMAKIRKVINIQAWVKGIEGRKRAKQFKLNFSATKIQRTWLRRKDQSVYALLTRAIHVAQQRWRMQNAKQQRLKLKQEKEDVRALMAKLSTAQQQAAEYRGKSEELEAQQLQLQSENKSLLSKKQQLEEKLAKLQMQYEDLKAEAEEAVKQAAEAAKTVIDTDSLNAMQAQLDLKDKDISELQAEIATLKQEAAKQKEDLSAAEARYSQLLKSTAMQSVHHQPQASSARASNKKAERSRCTVDIQLVGAPGVGKTALLEAFVQQYDPESAAKVTQEKQNMLSHVICKFEERQIKFLDCSGNHRCDHLVREWYNRVNWVFLVYDVTSQTSLQHCLGMMKELSGTQTKFVLFGNSYKIAKEGGTSEVNLLEIKDQCARANGLSMESALLADAVRMVHSFENGSDMGPEGEQQAPGGAMAEYSPDGSKRSSISQAIDSVKSWFGQSSERNGARTAHQGVLRPSLKGTKAMKKAGRDGDTNADLRPVQELQDSESAVTCIVFGQERLHKTYILLATASKDGTVVIYRCYRTEMEVAMLSDTDWRDEDQTFSSPPGDHSNIAVHSRLVGHSRAITSIFFNLLEDQLVTTSIDKSVRFWGVESGEMLKVFTDSSPVPVAAFLPFNPQVFVAANSNAVLRLVNVQNGMVLQKLKVETEVRALKFDDTGLFLLAGTKNGSIHVLEASDSSTLKFKFKVQLARGGVTCITFVAACYGQPPCLLVNTSDSSATIIDCTYGSPAGVLTNLAVRHRVRVAHSLLPLKCCYSPSGQGYLISGSEDKEVYIFNLGKATNYRMQYLKHHQVPVVAVAVNAQDTLLASADSLGRIVLWRRMDFSHIQE